MSNTKMINLFAAIFGVTTMLFGMMLVPGFHWDFLLLALCLCMITSLYLPLFDKLMASLQFTCVAGEPCERPVVGMREVIMTKDVCVDLEPCERPVVDMLDVISAKNNCVIFAPSLVQASAEKRSSLSALLFGLIMKLKH